jgi:hypothetical protein
MSIARKTAFFSRERTWPDFLLLLVLASPSICLVFTCPPLWRDVDGFNQVASTFAPMGIIHWLPGYCLLGRLVLILGGVLASLFTGHGFPYFSLGTPTLNDFGIYSLIFVQHTLLVVAEFYLIKVLTPRFWLQVSFAIFFAVTPWLYAFAHCIGSEAFSNPLVIGTAATGWQCLQRSERRVNVLFLGLLVAGLLTRQINLVLIGLMPIAILFFLLFSAGWRRRRQPGLPIRAAVGKFITFSLIGLVALLIYLLVQQTLCWCFRVTYRSTIGRTFEWRLRFLHDLSAQSRTALLTKISQKIQDSDMKASLTNLDLALRTGAAWDDLYLLHNLQNLLEQRGLHTQGQRDYQADLKLNQLAKSFLLPPEPILAQAIRNDLLRIRFLSPADLASNPFAATKVLADFLKEPRYARLRSLRSFQQPSDSYVHYSQGSWYFQLFHGLPFIWLVPGAAIAGIVALRRFTDQTATGLAYISSLLVIGLLFVAGSFTTTCFDARFLLPTYSCWQIGLMLAVALAVNGWRGPARRKAPPRLATHVHP